MKIKRFFAPDVRQAMRMVKDELGEDAVILSNRRVNGGVEIVSALDYDESMLTQTPEPAVTKTAAPQPPRSGKTRPVPVALQDKNEHKKPQIVWSQEPALVEMRSEIQNMRGLLETQLANLTYKDQEIQHPCHYELQRRLARLGFGATLTAKLLKALPEDGHVEESWRRLLGKMAVNIPVTNDDILTQGGVIALIGATGVGKTTTVAKLAARYSMRYGSRSVALISTDNFRIGAHEQLKAYSRILDVPVRFADSAESLQAALDYFCDKRLVLIDTAGMSQRDLSLSKQFAVLKGERERIKPYLVISATSRLSGLEEVMRGFSDINPHGCIITKVDESASLGQTLDLVIQHKLPVAYISDGQRVPED
ncbi:MAG: flagellar biosynthesis protein FlhF, partial [Pseudomonadota bacterium]|nr:flagellar biosynthesis protein FlhF [Pseudomonadota bacterium]